MTQKAEKAEIKDDPAIKLKRRPTVTINEIRLFISGIVFLSRGANTTPKKIEPPTQIEEKIR